LLSNGKNTKGIRDIIKKHVLLPAEQKYTFPWLEKRRA
jgi:hypothetical protein